MFKVLESYQKVMCDNYHNLIDDMIEKGYNNYNLWIESPTGFQRISNAYLKDENDTDTIQISWDWEEGYHELLINAENGSSCLYIYSQRIVSMYIDKDNDARYIILDDNNNEFNIFFH